MKIFLLRNFFKNDGAKNSFWLQLINWSIIALFHSSENHLVILLPKCKALCCFWLPNGFKSLAKCAWNWLDNLHVMKNDRISFLPTSIISFLDFVLSPFVTSFSLNSDGSVNSRLEFHVITFHFSSKLWNPVHANSCNFNNFMLSHEKFC